MSSEIEGEALLNADLLDATQTKYIQFHVCI